MLPELTLPVAKPRAAVRVLPERTLLSRGVALSERDSGGSTAVARQRLQGRVEEILCISRFGDYHVCLADVCISQLQLLSA